MRTKVLWLIKGLGLGGAEKLLVLAAPYLDRSRYEYEVAFLLPWKTALVQDLEKAGIATTCLNHSNPLDLRIVSRLARFMRERNVHLLHAHLPYTGVLGRIAARLAGVPCVVYTEHNLQERYHPLTRLVNQLTIRLCDVTIAVSDEVRHSLVRRPLARGARVVAIPNGVDVDGLWEAARLGQDVREELSLPPDRLVVGVVTVFRPQKRLDLWVVAAQRIAELEPRSVFIVVGDGPTRPDIEAQARQAGLNGRIIFTGLRRDAARLLAVFDVFMMSSIYEGLPVAVLEAMALGKPILATRVGGLPGVVEDGRHGFLVDAGDPAALGEKAAQLLGNVPLREAMGRASQERVREHFSIQRMVRATEDVYARALADAAGSLRRYAGSSST